MLVPRHALTRSNLMNIRAPSVGPAHLANSIIQASLSGPTWPHEREPKGRRIILGLRVRFAGLLAAFMVLGATPSATLAAECVGQPRSQADQDGHWYYRFDSLNHRKCWFLQQQPPSTGSSPAESDSTVAMKLSSFFSSLLATRQSVVSTKPQQEAVIGATTPESGADPIVPKRRTSSLHEKRWTLNAKRGARLMEHADEQPQLDQWQREALFDEFLRWTMRQEQAPRVPGQ
jgi:hypothetical protein